MILSRKSYLLRWAYWWEERWSRPDQVSLCLLFWRAFFIAPVMSAIIGGLVVILSPVWLLCVIDEKFDGRTTRRRWLNAMDAKYERFRPSRSVFYQGVKAMKARVCPLIEIRDE